MKFINTVELKNDANAILHKVTNGDLVIITYRGKPCAGLFKVDEKALEDLLFETSTRVKKAVREGLASLKKNKGVSLKDYVRHRFSS